MRFVSRLRSALRSGPLFFLAVLLALANAQAADFAVSPTQISLGINTSSELVITNQSTESVTLSVAGYTWSAGSGGQVELKSTDDLIVFPGIFKLLPLQRQILRVGVTTPSGPLERTYRVIVSELPAPQIRANLKGAAVRVLTAFSIPVFLSPLAAQTTVQFAGGRVASGKFQFDIANSGTVHVPPTQVQIVAKDAAGRAIWSHDFSAWYVLAGDHQNLSVSLPPEICGEARSFSVHFKAGELRLDHTFDGVTGSCRS